jgi:hypothetical protein
MTDNTRFAKTIVLSTNEKTLFAAGVSKMSGVEIGFIAAHKISDKFREVAVVSTNESSHKSKKGFYRLAKLEGTDILVAAGWLDLCIYYFGGSSFEKIVFLPTIHESSFR